MVLLKDRQSISVIKKFLKTFGTPLLISITSIFGTLQGAAYFGYVDFDKASLEIIQIKKEVRSDITVTIRNSGNHSAFLFAVELEISNVNIFEPTAEWINQNVEECYYRTWPVVEGLNYCRANWPGGIFGGTGNVSAVLFHDKTKNKILIISPEKIGRANIDEARIEEYDLTPYSSNFISTDERIHPNDIDQITINVDNSLLDPSLAYNFNLTISLIYDNGKETSETIPIELYSVERPKVYSSAK